MIEVRHATKSYGDRHNKFQAIQDISLKVPEGSTVAIMGKSGSGKSTLMHVISGLDHPDGGEVLVGGKNIFRLRGKDLDNFRNREVGFIFQSFFVEPNESCYQNVSLPLEIHQTLFNRRKKMVLEALDRVELKDKAYRRAGTLSGGEKQRLAIARAIVNEPSMIFADEPTGNLDTVTGAKVVELLFELNQHLGSTLFIVTHDLELASRCQMLFELRDGKLVLSSTTSAKKPTKRKPSKAKAAQ